MIAVTLASGSTTAIGDASGFIKRPENVEAICRIPRAQVEEAARLLWQARPVSYYAYSGHEHHANVTQTARAMLQLYALTGSFDKPGGNVLFAALPAAPIVGQELSSVQQMVSTVGLAERPLGPVRWGSVTARNLYRAILEGTPYPVRAVLGFGANMLLAHADGRQGREALKALDFYAHADLFMNPTTELADVVLPRIAAIYARFDAPNNQRCLARWRYRSAGGCTSAGRSPPGSARTVDAERSIRNRTRSQRLSMSVVGMLTH